MNYKNTCRIFAYQEYRVLTTAPRKKMTAMAQKMLREKCMLQNSYFLEFYKIFLKQLKVKLFRPRHPFLSRKAASDVGIAGLAYIYFLAMGSMSKKKKKKNSCFISGSITFGPVTGHCTTRSSLDMSVREGPTVPLVLSHKAFNSAA